MSSSPTSYDVIVVGGGMAGSAAACRAAGLGRRVLLLDGEDDPSAGGNSARSGGGVHLALAPLDTDESTLRDRLLVQAWGHRPVDFLDLLVRNAARALLFLREQGVQFESSDPGRVDLVGEGCFLAPKRDKTDLHAWPDRGPQRALRALQARCRDRGGEVVGATAMRELIQGATGAIGGVVTEDGRRITAGAVILADGGFQANAALRRRFIGPAADRMFLRGAGSGLGTGLLVAEAAGAKLENTHRFYGHLMHGAAASNDRLWPWPTLDGLLADGGILVDRSGRRLTDEGRGGIAAANVLGAADAPDEAWVVVDEAGWEDGAVNRRAFATAANPEIERRGGRIDRAGDPRMLAEVAGIDAAGLVRTLDAYNAATDADGTAQLAVPRTRQARRLSGALLAAPAVAGITYTLGGARTNGAMQVLNGEDGPIAGLFAAGATAATPIAGYVGGLASALICGLVAGERAAGGDGFIPRAR